MYLEKLKSIVSVPYYSVESKDVLSKGEIENAELFTFDKKLKNQER